MKKRISSLFAAAIIVTASVSVSWGLTLSADLANRADGFQIYDYGAGVTVGSTGSHVNDTVNINGSVFGPSYDDGPSASSHLWLAANNDSAHMLSSVNDQQIGSGNTPYAVAEGLITHDSANTVGFLTNAIYKQFFDVFSNGAISVSGNFRPSWSGDTPDQSTWRGIFQLIDLTDNVVIANGNTGWLQYKSADNSVLNILHPFSSGSVDVIAGHFYEFVAEAGVNGSMPGVAPVPEPSTIILLSSGLIGMYVLRKRSRSQLT